MTTLADRAKKNHKGLYRLTMLSDLGSIPEPLQGLLRDFYKGDNTDLSIATILNSIYTHQDAEFLLGRNDLDALIILDPNIIRKFKASDNGSTAWKGLTRVLDQEYGIIKIEQASSKVDRTPAIITVIGNEITPLIRPADPARLQKLIDHISISKFSSNTRNTSVTSKTNNTSTTRDTSINSTDLAHTQHTGSTVNRRFGNRYNNNQDNDD